MLFRVPAIRLILTVFLCASLATTSWAQSKPKSQSARPESAVIGSSRAKLVLVEYSDLECSDNASYTLNIFPKVKSNYVDTGLVRYEIRAFPLNKHPNAFWAEVAARCAGDQGKYWSMRKQIFLNQRFSNDDYSRYANTLGINGTRLVESIQAGDHVNEVKEDRAGGYRIGVTGTPTLILGRCEPGGPAYQTVWKKAEPGSYQEIKAVLDHMLNRQASRKH